MRTEKGNYPPPPTQAMLRDDASSEPLKIPAPDKRKKAMTQTKRHHQSE